MANSGPRPGKASRFKGVQRRKSGRWFASIVINKRTYYLGTYDKEEDAAAAYNKVAAATWNQGFIYLNPVPTHPTPLPTA